MDHGLVISRAEKEVVDIGANDERLSEVVNIQGKSEYQSYLGDTVLVREFVHGGECDQGVGISDTEGVGLADDVQNGKTRRQERTEDEHKAEVERSTPQS